MLERGHETAWRDAEPLASTPVQRELLSGLLVHAPQLASEALAGTGLYAVTLASGVALPLARGQLAPTSAAGLSSVPPLAIEVEQATTFAAAVLALQAARSSLPGLRAQASETKAAAGLLHPKLVAQTEGRLKSLVQDLARYLREAEENYAGAIRKPVFLDRVGDACHHAATLWQVTLAAADAARSQVDVQTRAPRFGEVQIEKALAALRDLQGQRRVLDVAARILAGWEQLRLMLGEQSPDSAEALRNARQTLMASEASDRTLAATLSACIDGAKVPDYVGKAEFIAHRSAARELIVTIESETLDAAAQALAAGALALDAGLPGQGELALLLQLDAQGRVTEVRSPRATPPTAPAAG
jgi:hypothetical protein